MREIKFRAWDKKLKALRYFTNPKDGLLYQDGEMIVSSGWDSYDMPTFDEPDNDRYILMQYTGLKDKNGKEIYEGDIIQWAEEHHGKREVIRWSNEESAWVCYNPTDCGSWLSGISDIGKVIGSIHENPELLER